MGHLPSIKVGEVSNVLPSPPSTNSTTSPMTTPNIEVPGSVSPRKRKSIVTENILVPEPQQRPCSSEKSLPMQIPALTKELLSLGPDEQQNNSADTTSSAHSPSEVAEVSFPETEEQGSRTSHTELPAQPLGGFSNPSKTIAESSCLPTRENAVLSKGPTEHAPSEMKIMAPPALPPKLSKDQFTEPEQRRRPTSTLKTMPNFPPRSPKNKISIKINNNKSGMPENKPSPTKSFLGEEIDDTVLPSIEGLTTAELQLNGLERGTSRPVSSPSTLFNTPNLFGKVSEKCGEIMSDGLSVPNKEELDIFGCIVCGPKASCIVSHASLYFDF